MIERRYDLTRSEFQREFQAPRRPVVLSSAVCGGPQSATLTPAVFSQQFGDVKTPAGLTLRDVIERVVSGVGAVPYPCHFDLPTHFPALLDRIMPRLPFNMFDRLRHPLMPARLHRESSLDVFFGTAGSLFPYLHWDILHVHTFLTQVYGTKEYTLFAPSDSPMLYSKPGYPWQSTIENHHEPDLARYPLYALATPHRVALEAGETLFMPAGWWHTARCVTGSITLGVNQVNRTNWKDFCIDVHRVHKRKKPVELGLRALLGTLGPVLDVLERAADAREFQATTAKQAHDLAPL